MFFNKVIPPTIPRTSIPKERLNKFVKDFYTVLLHGTEPDTLFIVLYVVFITESNSTLCNHVLSLCYKHKPFYNIKPVRLFWMLLSNPF
jgi:hypothetical protein